MLKETESIEGTVNVTIAAADVSVLTPYYFKKQKTWGVLENH